MEREREGGRVVALMLVGLVVLMGGGYAAAYAGAGEELPRGTTISGVKVGGKSPAEATAALEAGLSERISAPIPVSIDGTTSRVTPKEAGLSVDYAESVAQAGGEKSWAPGDIWNHYTGGDDHEAVVEVDEARMSATVERLIASAGTLPKDGAIRFTRSGLKVTDPVIGQQVGEQEARDALEAAYLQAGTVAEMTLAPAEPEIDEGDVQEALEEFANPAVSDPVTLVFDETEVQLLPREFGPTLRLVPEDGELVPDLRAKKLIKLVEERISVDGAPTDASFEIVDGKPRVVRSRPGVTYTPSDVSDAFLALVTKPEGKRVQKVPATVAEADFTTADAKALGIKEQVSTFTTYFPYAEYRNVNLGRAAELIDGTVLEPGETFSLNDTVGERTRENGFTEGFIISNGVYKEELGGGVSQMATTLFNAMYFAGLKDIEHRPHSFYIDRYPIGREATVVWGALDLRFQNDTDYGVLIKTSLSPSSPSSQGALTVTMYSTKVWDITSANSDRYNFTEEKTRTIRDEDCTPHEGYAGFDIDVTRYFRKVGSDELHHSEKFHTTYLPSDSVVCKPPKR